MLGKSESTPPEASAPASTARERSAARFPRLLVAIVVVAACLYVGRDYLGELGRMRTAGLPESLGILTTYLLARLVSAEQTRAALRRFGHRVGLGESFLLMILVSYANLAIPRSGLGAPAIYLKRRHGIPYAEFGAVLFSLTLMMLVAVGAVGLLALLSLTWVYGQELDGPVAVVFGAVGLLATAGFLIRLPVPATTRGRVGTFLRRMMAASALLSRSRSLAVYILFLEVLGVLIRAARLHLALLAIGAHANPVGVLVASLLGELTWLVSLTPSALGVREAAVSYGSRMMGITPALALSAAVLDRLIWSLGVVVIAQVAIWLLARADSSVKKTTVS